jgi:hypothetical protein
MDPNTLSVAHQRSGSVHTLWAVAAPVVCLTSSCFLSSRGWWWLTRTSPTMWASASSKLINIMKRGSPFNYTWPYGTVRHDTSTAGHGHGRARRHAVTCLLVPPCQTPGTGTTLWGVWAVSCPLARWHTSARAGPDTITVKHITHPCA